ncbi:MAG: bifunctional enoyl-CoA hydratase/phosphate acetyltransferase [Rhodospirillales bacterium]|nr:bifunctional enoyl-CoA hydratase/phosphate acetyltransferase [Rhodospirillales bacterium]MDH3791110.1 bifunctional enoyl-CoA hydratase/phosphate acetyltransferase [Rhodospirillales bacterium]MDH3913582.1 bifunctional enoyl-CoA hydratase/phosphate acetyltransferase [Rhodospirillales bacterium]MDH3919292.1 bifunctional enoyl-CoA hydratase/phosphate acetyltransferase [Rhodospirillales bacterium]MDH3968716.1 bifunctional enoyl-CoA hydratase/phosphate acetyltransferase [Rhodospirillales bacterium
MLSTLPFECPSELLERGRAGAPTPTAIAGAAGELALESARRATEEGLIEPVLVGEALRIADLARSIDWDIQGLRIVAAGDEAAAAEAAVALARGNEVAAVMKGQIPTDVLMRAVVDRQTGLRTGQRLSHVFYMTAPGRKGAFTITDAAVNIAPDVETRLHITRNAVALHHALGEPQPKVAMLSATEHASAAMPSSLEAAEIVERAADEVAGALVEGPFALDIAISPQAAAVKGVESEVAGRADILVVPNIETGNALFKAMVYFLSATAAGLVLGAMVPIVLTSRADPPEARLAATALAAIVAGYESEKP